MQGKYANFKVPKHRSSENILNTFQLIEGFFIAPYDLEFYNFFKK